MVGCADPINDQTIIKLKHELKSVHFVGSYYISTGGPPYPRFTAVGKKFGKLKK